MKGFIKQKPHYPEGHVELFFVVVIKELRRAECYDAFFAEGFRLAFSLAIKSSVAVLCTTFIGL